MDVRRLLCCVLLLASVVTATLQDDACNHTIYVSNSNGSSLPSCWTGGMKNPCQDLDLALQGAQSLNGSVRIVIIQQGQYNISGSNTFKNRSGIALEAQLEPPGTVNISCGPGAGLAFRNVSEIKLQDVAFFGCGAEQVSTSVNFTANSSALTFQAALYFLLCESITISGVSVSNSNGTGLSIVDTGGNNIIENSIFVNNTSSELPGGGGVYIEFSNCIPGNETCMSSNVPQEYVSNANYTITDCRFVQNNATTGSFQPAHNLYSHGQNNFAFGRGGGLSVFFKGSAMSNYITITSSWFKENGANLGAGLYISLEDYSQNNTVVVESAHYLSNNCSEQVIPPSILSYGGGAGIAFMLYKNETRNNQVVFRSSEFIKNNAYQAGGLGIISTSVESDSALTNKINVVSCNFTNNIARVGAAINVFQWFSITYPYSNGHTALPRFSNCNFTSNGGQYMYIPSTNPRGTTFATVYIVAMSTSFSGETHFIANQGSALVIQSTSLEFKNNSVTTFTGNTGRIGAGVMILGNAWIVVNKNCNLTFVNNKATEKGGAIFAIQTEQHYSGYVHMCFIRYIDPYVPPYDWTVTFSFTNNSAFGRNNSIHATSLLPCTWPDTTIQHDLDQTFCWDNWKYHESNCTQEIETSAVKLHRNVNDSDNLSVFPGRPQPLNVQAQDEWNKDVTNQTIFTASTTDSSMDLSLLYISNDSLSFYAAPGTNTNITLETFDAIAVSLELNTTILSCPQGLVYDNTSMSCTCGKGYGGLVECNAGDFRSYVSIGVCVSYSPEESLIAVRCPFTVGYHQVTERRQLPIALNLSFCKELHREGRLCSKCVPNYGIAVFSSSFTCVPCKGYIYANWLKYFAVELIPLTAFFVVVFIFHIGVTTAAANAFVFFSQVVSLPVQVLTIETGWSLALHADFTSAAALTDILIFPYAIWNLDFSHIPGTDFCLEPSISGIYILLLQYVSAIYPLILAGIVFAFIELHARNCRPVVCLWKYLCIPIVRFRRAWQPRTSVINAFATFILLSYTRFVRVSLSLLIPARVYNDEGIHVDTVLRYDPYIGYLNSEHLPYAILSILVLVFFGILTPLVLLFYPFRWFQKLLNSCNLNRHSLHTFIDAFQGCYRDGSNRRSDCRYFAGIYFVLRITIFAINTVYTDSFVGPLLYSTIVYTIGILLFTFLQPYKQKFYNSLDAMFLAVMVVTNVLNLNIYVDLIAIPSHFDFITWVVFYLLLFIPLLYIAVFSVYKISTCSGLFQRWRLSRLRRQVMREDEALYSSMDTSTTVTDMQVGDDEYPHRVSSPEHYKEFSFSQQDSLTRTDAEQRMSNVLGYGATSSKESSASPSACKVHFLRK